MRALIDTNVILDVLLRRDPHYSHSAEIWALVEQGLAQGSIAAHAVTTVHYVVRKHLGAPRATEVIRLVLDVFDVADVSAAVLARSIALEWPDFEDAVTASAALAANCDLIVTRDTSGFSRSPVKALTPRSALSVMKGRPPGRSRR